MNYYLVKFTVKNSLEGQSETGLKATRYQFSAEDPEGAAEEPLTPFGS